MDDLLWTWGQVAKRLGCSKMTVRRMVAMDKHFPRPIILRGKDRATHFRAAAIVRWVENLPSAK